MNEKEHKELQKVFKASAKKILSSKEVSKAFLIDAGILDKNGNLSKHYQPAP